MICDGPPAPVCFDITKLSHLTYVADRCGTVWGVLYTQIRFTAQRNEWLNQLLGQRAMNTT